jgi:hypothetical protein
MVKNQAALLSTGAKRLRAGRLPSERTGLWAEISIRPPIPNRLNIARRNTFSLLGASEQVYSAAPDFCWIDHEGKYQTDWRMLDKQRIIDSARLIACDAEGS